MSVSLARCSFNRESCSTKQGGDWRLEGMLEVLSTLRRPRKPGVPKRGKGIRCGRRLLAELSPASVSGISLLIAVVWNVAKGCACLEVARSNSADECLATSLAPKTFVNFSEYCWVRIAFKINLEFYRNMNLNAKCIYLWSFWLLDQKYQFI